MRPALAVSAGVLAAALAALGVWQLDRADEKRALAEALAARAQVPARSIDAVPVDAGDLVYLPVRARGRYEPRLQFLVSNRVHRQRIGFHVVTPLVLEGSPRTYLLVNRGWVAQPEPGGSLGALEPPAGQVEVAGTAAIPTHNVFAALFGGSSWRAFGHAVYAQIDLGEFARTAAAPVQPLVLQLAAAPAAGGFEREWPAPDLRPDKNVGYAFQWFAMAFAVLAVYVWTGLRRHGPRRQDNP